MRLSRLTIQNFKSIRHTELQFDDFTVLIGANAAGKTNIVQALKFLKDVSTEGFDNAFSLQGSSNYFSNSRLQTANNDCAIYIQFFPSEHIYSFETKDKSIFGIPQRINYQLHIPFLNQRANDINRVDFIKADVIWKEFPPLNDSLSPTLTQYVEIKHRLENEGLVGKFILAPNPDTGRFFFSVQNQDKQSQYALEYLNNIDLGKTLLLVEDTTFFLSKHVVDELIQVGIYNFSIKELLAESSFVGRKNLESNGSNLLLILKRIMEDIEKRHQFLLLLEYALPFIKNITVDSTNGRSLVALLTEKYDESFPLPSVFFSEGTISVIALIIVLFFEEKSVVVIEEPERYVHPSLLAKLVELMKDASGKKQVIITTHSPEIVKQAGIENLLLIQRDKEGFTTASKPVDSQDVKIFLQNEIGLDDLFIDNLLGV